MKYSSLSKHQTRCYDFSWLGFGFTNSAVYHIMLQGIYFQSMLGPDLDRDHEVGRVSTHGWGGGVSCALTDYICPMWQTVPLDSFQIRKMAQREREEG